MLRSFDDWRASAPECDAELPTACPVCTGDETAQACSEECHVLVEKCRREKQIARFYRRATTSLAFAHLYRADGGPNDTRFIECVKLVKSYREAIRTLRRAA